MEKVGDKVVKFAHQKVLQILIDYVHLVLDEVTMEKILMSVSYLVQIYAMEVFVSIQMVLIGKEKEKVQVVNFPILLLQIY